MSCLGVQPFIRRKSPCVNCTEYYAKLLYRLWVLKIQQLVVTPHNSIANHFCRPALLRLPIRIQGFRHAGTAIGAMGALKTAAQARVAVIAFKITIARHMINDSAGRGEG